MLSSALVADNHQIRTTAADSSNVSFIAQTPLIWETVEHDSFRFIRFIDHSPIAGYHYTEQSHAPVPEYFGVVDPYNGPAYPINRMPDYIIICASGLYDDCSQAIDSLAEHRVSLNGFDVATILTDSILAEFSTNGQTILTDTIIRDFTEHMWGNWPGASLNHPSYLLLIGDHEDTSCAAEDWFLPTHVYTVRGADGPIPGVGNDEWYVYFNGNRDINSDFPDMMVGRLSIKNGGTIQTDTLSAMIDNIIALEQPIQSAPLTDYRRRILRLAGSGQAYPKVYHQNFGGLNTPLNPWTSEFADWMSYDFATHYCGDGRWFTYTDSSYMKSRDWVDSCITEFERGAGLSFYTDHGELHMFSAGLEWCPDFYSIDDTKGARDSTFNNYQITQNLTGTAQGYSAPFTLLLCCSAGTFNHTEYEHRTRSSHTYFCHDDGSETIPIPAYDFGTDCIAERILKNTDVPVAGVFCGSQPSSMSSYNVYGMGILEAVYARGCGRLGDAIACARSENYDSFITATGAGANELGQFNLLGDPALDISDRVRYPGKCDLEIYTDDINISQYPWETATGINLPVSITVQNNGRQESDEYDVKVTVTHGTSVNVSYINDCAEIPGGGSAVLEHAYTPSSLSMPLNVTVMVEVDFNHDCEDSWRGNNEAEATIQLVDTYPTQSGWPIQVQGAISTTPVLVNLDSDASLEIVSLTGTSLTAFDTDGTKMWQLMSEGFSSAAHPLAADLDADGHPEIILYCFGGNIKVIDYQGSVIDSLENATDVFAVGNLSSNTGLELCVAYGNTIVLYGLSSGSLTILATKNFGYQDTRSPVSLACADLGGSHTYQDVAYLNGGFDEETSPSPPRKSTIEIYNWSTSSSVYSKTWNEFVNPVVLSAGSLNGIESIGYPGKAYSTSSDVPALLIEPIEEEEYDCDNEDMLPTSRLVHGVITDWDATTGNDTYVLPSERQCMAWEIDGEGFSDFPTQEFSGASPGSPVSPVALGNLDSSTDAEVLFSTVISGSNSVLAYDSDGNLLPSSKGWPFKFPDGVGAYGGFAVADLDRDGNVEVVFGTNDGLLHCWEFGSCTTGYAPWPMYQHDFERSGALE